MGWPPWPRAPVGPAIVRSICRGKSQPGGRRWAEANARTERGLVVEDVEYGCAAVKHWRARGCGQHGLAAGGRVRQAWRSAAIGTESRPALDNAYLATLRPSVQAAPHGDASARNRIAVPPPVTRRPNAHGNYPADHLVSSRRRAPSTCRDDIGRSSFYSTPTTESPDANQPRVAPAIFQSRNAPTMAQTAPSSAPATGLAHRKFHGCSSIREYEIMGKLGEGTFG